MRMKQSQPTPFPPKHPFPPSKPSSEWNHELEGVEYGESSRLWFIGMVIARGVGKMVDMARVQREGEGDSSAVFTERLHASKQSLVRGGGRGGNASVCNVEVANCGVDPKSTADDRLDAIHRKLVVDPNGYVQSARHVELTES
ncbi:hypothetical protein ONZ45_g12262 [Pleurotus djamor]|nr:hypothetical protein ONZ45_g12262 [Pleurotus djamor]